MGDLHLVVAGVPYGHQNVVDGRWVTEEQRERLRTVGVERVTEWVAAEGIPARDLDPADVLLVETSGTKPDYESIPGIVLRADLEELLTPKLRLVQLCSVGVEHVQGLLPPELTVANAGGVHAPAIAETVMAALLHHWKRVDDRRRLQASRTWQAVACDELTDKTLCVVGTGHIGVAVARRARGFGMRVYGVRRSEGIVDGFDRVLRVDALAEVLPEVDAIVLACPLTPETTGLIGQAELAALPEGAYLANVSRGEVVDEPPLIEALRSGHLGGALLDAHIQEPLPPDHPFWSIDSAMVLPHDSHSTPLLGDHIIDLLHENIRRVTTGDPVRNRVDFGRGY